MRQAAVQLPQLPVVAGPPVDGFGRPCRGWAPTAAQAADVRALLDQALAARQSAVLAAAVVHAVLRGWDDTALAQWLCAALADRGLGASPVAWAVADIATTVGQVEPDRRAVPWAVAAALVSDACDAAPRSALAVQTACWAAGPRGLALIAAYKASQLATVSGAVPVAAVAPVQDDAGHAARRLAWAAQLPLWADRRDETKARAFVEPKFRAHLLQGGIDGAQKAVCRGLDVGIPHELIAQSLVLAAADRLWRCDPQPDTDPHAAVGRADAETVFVLAASVRQLRGRVDPQAWLDLLLFATGQVAALAVLDVPASAVPALPEPAALHQTWDHGPEIAKVIGYLNKGCGQEAVAVLRAYFLLALPEQPLCAQLREAVLADRRSHWADQARGIALGHAAIDEFMAAAGHPHRELILAAALVSLCVPMPARSSLALAEAAWQRRHLGVVLPAPGLGQ